MSVLNSLYDYFEKIKIVQKIILLILFITFNSYLSYSQNDSVRIVKFELNGLKRSKPVFLNNCIDINENSHISMQNLSNKIQNLRNTDLFSKVDYSLSDTINGKILTVTLNEKMSRLPSFNGGLIKDDYWFQIGILDFHLLGRGIRGAAFFRYFQKPSFSAYIITPYIRESKWGQQTFLEYTSKREPLNIKDDSSIFIDIDLKKADLFITKEFKFKNILQLGIGYETKTTTFLNDNNSDSKTQITETKFPLTFKIDLENNLNYTHQYLHGFSHNFSSQISVFPYNGFYFWEVHYTYKYFREIKRSGNFGLRMRLNIAENNSPYLGPFVHDSYTTVRGIGNKQDRGNAEITLNMEYRHTIFDNHLLAIQGVFFTDLSSLNPSNQNYNKIFLSENREYYSGIGVRFFAKTVSKFIVRADYGFSLKDTNRGFVFGLLQYF